ncbi:MAG: class I mannose-6-phosphate isomerase [Clostridia bacterium]|nr:class I mannose-6-phosphate isomerase [Clostridia bacterium]
MKIMNIYPMKMKPVTKKIIWGGSRLAAEYGKGTEGEKLAESWELTCRADGMSVICGGEYDGMTLEEYFRTYPQAVGDTWDGERFPLLIKLIDAEADLSIQVHPDDEYALSHTTDLGKTEMWYIVDAEPGAHIIYGLKEKYTRQQIADAIASGTLESLMNYQPVKKGETYFIPSGMVHAICHGILIAEIQQNSNITYRVYDYNRRQPDGSLRQLHVDDALNVIERVDPGKMTYTHGGDVIAGCKYFTVKKYDVTGTVGLKTDAHSFANVLCTDGCGVIEYCGKAYSMNKGDSYLIPAGAGEYSVSADTATVVVTTL